jgi:hypothetical protein
MLKPIIFTAIVLGVIGGVPGVGAAETVRLNCRFDVYASPDGLGAEDFNLEYLIDTITEKAFLVGNLGVSEVVMVSGGYGVSFYELLATGAMQSTSMTYDGQAVHSRHTMVATNEMILSQYYGLCE